ncbi:EF-hand calcium-binding domain-containing protein 4A [Xenentodon cancila]
MSKWLSDDEVLVGQGSGEAVLLSPRPRGRSAGSPRQGRGCSPLASPQARETVPLSPQAEIMGKAKELFVLCDKEGKGFITKRDMQRLQGELPLSSEQLETVFESLDRENNGFLTPAEFNTGLGELMGLEDTAVLSTDEAGEDGGEVDCSQDPNAVAFVSVLMELGADKHFKDFVLCDSQQELCSLWCVLQSDRPELLSALEGVLVHTVSHLQDTISERDSLEQALRRRESEHDQMVRSIYEEMENQIREEREKWLAQDTIKERQRGQQLQEELRLREQELENTLSKQRELETRIRQLSCEQANIREQNQRLRRLNMQLQEQVESSKEQLQAALSQLSMLQSSAAQEQVARQRNVIKVSKNMKKEKDSLLRQLEILRDMNRKLRDEKDAQQSQKRSPNVTKPLQKKGSVIGNYLLQDKSVRRLLSSSDELEMDKKKDVTDSSMTHPPLCRVRDDYVEQKQTQVGYRSITEQYYRKADGVLAMYDVTHPASFIAVRGWMDSVKEKTCEGTVLMLLGNKLDLTDNNRRKVTTAEGQRLAEQYQALFHECSAKTGHNMDELMNRLAGMLVRKDDQQCVDAVLLTEDTAEREFCTCIRK